MKKAIAVLVIILLIATVTLAFLMRNEVMKKTRETEYDKIMAVDLEINYPTSAYDVLAFNNRITSYLYGGDCLESEVPTLIEQNRRLLSNEILMLNEYEFQVETALKEINHQKEAGEKIIKIEISNSIDAVIAGNPPVATAVSDVVQYVNTANNNYLRYYLKMIDGKWKIEEWEKIEKGDTYVQ